MDEQTCLLVLICNQLTPQKAVAKYLLPIISVVHRRFDGLKSVDLISEACPLVMREKTESKQ